MSIKVMIRVAGQIGDARFCRKRTHLKNIGPPVRRAKGAGVLGLDMDGRAIREFHSRLQDHDVIFDCASITHASILTISADITQ
jgi:hypothetical protein